MKIGKDGPAHTAISTADAASITVRGKDLCGDLMGRLSFTEHAFLLITGREPTKQQAEFLDLVLVSIAEHGLVPTNQVARMTLAAEPDALQGAVAAGLLGCGSVILGASENCGRALTNIMGDIARSGRHADEAIRDWLYMLRTEGGRVPGFGHPLHDPVDPRAERLLELAEDRGIAERHVALAKRIAAHIPEVWGKALPMNVTMAIAAIMLDLDFPPAMLKAIPILARTASLLGHLAEEQEKPIGFALASAAAEAVTYSPED